MTEQLPSIKHKVCIHAAPAEIYLYISTGAGWDAWFTNGTIIDNGRIVLKWAENDQNQEISDGCPVVSAVTDKLFSFR